MSIAYEQKAVSGLQQLGLTTAYDQLDSATQNAAAAMMKSSGGGRRTRKWVQISPRLTMPANKVPMTIAAG